MAWDETFIDVVSKMYFGDYQSKRLKPSHNNCVSSAKPIIITVDFLNNWNYIFSMTVQVLCEKTPGTHSARVPILVSLSKNGQETVRWRNETERERERKGIIGNEKERKRMDKSK